MESLKNGSLHFWDKKDMVVMPLFASIFPLSEPFTK
jgi:hypothetical protein